MKTLINIICFFHFTLSALSPDMTVVKFEGSSMGDVARGLKKTFRGHDSTIIFTPWGVGGIIITCDAKDGKGSWIIQIAAPHDKALLAKSYDGALRAGNDGSWPWLSFGYDGRGYNEASGEFQILELSYDAEGKIKSLALEFHQRNGEGNVENWVKGSVRLNSGIPLKIPDIKRKAK